MQLTRLHMQSSVWPGIHIASIVPSVIFSALQGKVLMLITNSDYHYTNKMMSFAYNRFMPPGSTWRDLFDMVGDFYHHITNVLHDCVPSASTVLMLLCFLCWFQPCWTLNRSLISSSLCKNTPVLCCGCVLHVTCNLISCSIKSYPACNHAYSRWT